MGKSTELINEITVLTILKQLENNLEKTITSVQCRYKGVNYVAIGKVSDLENPAVLCVLTDIKGTRGSFLVNKYIIRLSKFAEISPEYENVPLPKYKYDGKKLYPYILGIGNQHIPVKR